MSFKDSQGERYSKANIDANIRVAKSLFISDAIDEGKQYCWACGTTNERLSCSHIISVNECQNDGKCEVAWFAGNLQLECIPCHRETENRNFGHHANYRYKMAFIKAYELRKIRGIQKVD
jgi:hypothetical protein